MFLYLFRGTSISDLFSIVSELPDALNDANHWNLVLSKLAYATGAEHVFVSERDPLGSLQLDDNPWESPFVYGYDGEAGIRPYLDYFHQFDEWGKFELSCERNQPALLSEFAGPMLGARSEFWDWLNPLGITDNAYVKLFDTDAGWVGLNLHFNRDISDIESRLSVLQKVCKPLSTSLQLHFNGFGFYDELEAQLLSSEIPKLLIRASGKIVAINSLAEQLIATHSGTFKTNGKLAFLTSSIQNQFRQALAEAGSDGMARIFSLPLDLERADMTVVVLPVPRRSSASLDKEPLLELSFIGRELPSPLLRPLASAYGLTPRQTTVLAEVEKGKNVRQIAKDLELSYDYVRSILYKDIFPALNVSDLPELVALLGKVNRAAQ